ncbi:CLUMA_CG010267, isoform A [Clunio marinus]|uniref:CLUMA_CG010267, isoform A n=1 Tax=Clunio marinus TaxID=568069 RepID=A0A1J1I986_9DIPT|nr:CLUMA_CG010267, isoform A [Clunio marinus]
MLNELLVDVVKAKQFVIHPCSHHSFIYTKMWTIKKYDLEVVGWSRWNDLTLQTKRRLSVITSP